MNFLRGLKGGEAVQCRICDYSGNKQVHVAREMMFGTKDNLLRILCL